MTSWHGKALTVCGPVEPAALGRVMMHEHLHSDCYDWERQELIDEEKPITPERRDLLRREAVPFMAKWPDYGCRAYVETTPAPWRAWPDMYVEAAHAANIHIILCTGFYAEMNPNEYWVKKEADRAWSFMRDASEEAMADFCIREILEGVHGTAVHAGAIKLGTRNPVMSAIEAKAFRAGAKAQRATGVHITTHCTQLGAETDQLSALDRAGVDLSRVVIGHTAWHLMHPDYRKICIEWMRRGANFLPTNLGVTDDGACWRPLIEAIHEVFDAGLGDKLSFGTDWAFVSESEPFTACTFIPPPPFIHFFTNTLPAFRAMGLTPAEEETMMATNPQRVIPVQ